MYSRIAGTGDLSAPLGIHSRPARRRPSAMGIHCSSTSRNLPSTSRRIVVIGLPASGIAASPFDRAGFSVRHGIFCSRAWNRPKRALSNPAAVRLTEIEVDRKSTRLNSSHLGISYAVFCLKNKKPNHLVSGRLYEGTGLASGAAGDVAERQGVVGRTVEDVLVTRRAVVC